MIQVENVCKSFGQKKVLCNVSFDVKDGETLVVLGYPKDDVVMLGLFMMNVDYQGKGIGSKIIDECANYLKRLGYKKIRIGVDKENPQSNHFWLKNNFKKVEEQNQEYNIMEKSLI